MKTTTILVPLAALVVAACSVHALPPGGEDDGRGSLASASAPTSSADTAAPPATPTVIAPATTTSAAPSTYTSPEQPAPAPDAGSSPADPPDAGVTAPAPTTTSAPPAPTTTPPPDPLPPATGASCVVVRRASPCVEETTTEHPRFWLVPVGSDVFGGVATDSQGVSELYGGAPAGYPIWKATDATHALYVGYDSTSERVSVAGGVPGGAATISESFARAGSPPPGCAVPLVRVTCSGSVSL